MVRIKPFLTAYKKSLIVALTPLVLMPLLFLDELDTLSEEDLCKLFQKDQDADCSATIARLQTDGNEPVMFKCAYTVLLMVIYWCFEAAPLPGTSLIPLFAYPFLGVVKAKVICASYFKDVVVLFFGGLALAIAIEVWNLHKRIALFVLTKVGAKPAFLLAGFMVTTSFISMWMSNVATTAMMVPIAQAVLVQLKETMDNESKENTMNGNNHEDQVMTTELKGQEDSQLLEKENSEEKEILSRMHNGLCKALMLGIAYCASIGGVGMLTGTGPNLIAVAQADTRYSFSINFVNWAAFATPLCILMTVIAWALLVWMFLRVEGREKVDSAKQTEIAGGIIQGEYDKLGDITFPEKMIIGMFVMLLSLWLTRQPGGPGTGWSVYFKDKYVSDGSSAILIGFLLFVLPAEPPFRTDENGEYIVSKPLLTWKQVAGKMGWGVIFLLGGGFAMAKGITESGMGDYVGIKMSGLKGVSAVAMVFLCCLVINLMTQVTSNSSTMMIFAALLCNMAENLGINPMYLLVPCAASVSMAFCLPVSTPPNAVVFDYGYMSVGEMVKVGLPLSLIGALVSGGMIHILGPIASVFDIFNTCPYYVNATNPNALACQAAGGGIDSFLSSTTSGPLPIDVNVTLN